MNELEKWCAAIKARMRGYRGVIVPAFVSAILAYGFAMTNLLVNWDGARMLGGEYGAGLSSGRWLLGLLGGFVSRVWGSYTLPLPCGVIACVLLTAAACVLVSVLEIKNKLLRAVTSSLFVVFPAAACAMIYMFTAHYYALAVLLALLGALCVKKMGGRGVLPAACLISFSLGIYQAYLPLAASVMALALLRECFEGSESLGRLFSRMAFYLLSLVSGVLLYYAELALCLAVTPSELSGFHDVGAVLTTLGELPGRALRAYGGTVSLPFRVRWGVNDTAFIRVMVLASFAVTLALFLALVAFYRVPWGRRAAAAAVMAALPLAFGSIELLPSATYIHTLMSYGSAGVFIAPAMLADTAYAAADRLSFPRRRAVSAVAAVTAVVIALSSANYIWQSNGNLMLVHTADEQAKEYFTTMITRLRSAEGFDDEKKLAVIGEEITDATYKNALYELMPFRFSGTPDSMLNVYSRPYFMLYSHGFVIGRATEEETEALAATEAVRAMSVYPDDGSIAVIGDFIVLKLED